MGFSCNQTQGLPSVFTLQNELCVSLRPDKRADCFSISNPALFTSLQYPSSYCSITPLSTLPSAIVNQRNSLVSMLAQNGHPLVETLIRSSTSGQELHSTPRFTLRFCTTDSMKLSPTFFKGMSVCRVDNVPLTHYLFSTPLMHSEVQKKKLTTFSQCMNTPKQQQFKAI